MKQNKNKYHYVYRISNSKLKKHYYGVRSSKLAPHLDLGVKYFSSSKDKSFIQDQQLNPWFYKYKIIAIFETREDAVRFEIKLHNRFDVGKNPSFYNKAKQTSQGFDTTGISYLTDDQIQYRRQRWLIDNPNKYRSNAGENNPMFGTHRSGVENPFYGKEHSEEAKIKISESKKGKPLPEEWKQKLKESWAKRTTIQCPWCKLEMRHRGNYKRYHGNNCKMRRENED